MIKYGNLNVNIIGNANKIYQGLTKGGYQWVDIDSFESITLQEQLTCCGLRFSVDDYMNVEGGKPSWWIGEICEIDGQRKYGSFRIKNDELVLILDGWGGRCGEDEEGQPIYMELGRWHRGENVELESDTLTVRWDMSDDTMYNIPWKCYIDRKGTGRIVYQRLKKEEPTKNYLRFKALDDCVFSFNKQDGEVLYYSLDSGDTWTELTEQTPTIHSGEYIYWKGQVKSYRDTTGEGRRFISCFHGTCGDFSIEGNIMSLLYGDNFEGKTNLEGNDKIFGYLFARTSVVDASNLILPATTLANSCYISMFKGCDKLTATPELPATTLAEACYASMFQGCFSLTTAPELPATTLALGCYNIMFRECGNLNYIKCLAPEITANNCYNWVNGVAATGTFVKKAGVSWSSGTSGIPKGWTVEEE